MLTDKAPSVSTRATVAERGLELVAELFLTADDSVCSTGRYQPSEITRMHNLNTTTTPKTHNPQEAQYLPITGKEARTYKTKGVQG